MAAVSSLITVCVNISMKFIHQSCQENSFHYLADFETTIEEIEEQESQKLNRLIALDAERSELTQSLKDLKKLKNTVMSPQVLLVDISNLHRIRLKQKRKKGAPKHWRNHQPPNSLTIHSQIFPLRWQSSRNLQPNRVSIFPFDVQKICSCNFVQTCQSHFVKASERELTSSNNY
jgi:hypothetical protein